MSYLKTDNFDIVSRKCFPEHYSNADGKFLLWLEKAFGIGTGRRKACSEAGLSGAEKRACVKKLRKSGWVKGQPIPSDIVITEKDVVEAEKYPPLPTEVYESPYQATPYTAVTKEEDGIISTYYPEQPKGEVMGGKKSAWEEMGGTEKAITVVGVSSVIGLTIYGIVKTINKNRVATPVLATS